MKTSPITITTRQALVPVIKAYAEENGESFNTVMAAVLWLGEQSAIQLSTQALTSLITDDTINAYKAELMRRALAADAQVRGMIRNALPFDLRTDENVALIECQVTPGMSIPEIQQVITDAIGITS